MLEEKFCLRFGNKNMSRTGKKPIKIPEKTEVKVSGNVLSVKGPLGELKKNFDSNIVVSINGGEITVKPAREDASLSVAWGTTVSHIKNMLAGVNKNYEKKLIIEGIGFKADIKGKEIVFGLGFSHPVKLAIPDGLKVVSDKTGVTVTGINKEVVGEFTAKIRSLKKPEPYKGKGIRYDTEVIRRKEGKKTA